MDPSSWNMQHMHGVQDQQPSEATLHDDDFARFLDIATMGNVSDAMTFGFSTFDPQAAVSDARPTQQNTHRSALDIPMGGIHVPDTLVTDNTALRQQPRQTQQHSHHQPPHQQHIDPEPPGASFPALSNTIMPPTSPSETMVDTIGAQIQFLQQQQKLQHQQHQQRQLTDQLAATFFANQHNRMVPPTPQSLELRPGASPFFVQTPNSEQQRERQQQRQRQQQQQRQQQPVDYRFQQMGDQEMAFTPLVSPAVTPLEGHFPVDVHFAMTGNACFSPLTSPALHAQSDSLLSFDQRAGPLNTGSPVEMDLETGPASAVPNPPPGDLAKKIRKNAAKASARPKAGVKQSPISRRKPSSTPKLSAQVLGDLTEGLGLDGNQHLVRTAPASASSTAGATDSEVGSVSPEPMPDQEMPPPPIPKSRSARPSPYMGPQTGVASALHHPGLPNAPCPATPTSLMKLSSPHSRSHVRGGSSDADHIESFSLPEPVNFQGRAVPNRASTHSAADSHAGHTRPALPSPRHIKQSSSAAAAASSASPSPQLTSRPGLGAPAATVTSGARKMPQITPRGSNKRPSAGSAQVSPALRPKISPSIKPLLPSGALAEEAAELLLTTKSNYQRILEGNTVPGMSFPSELSTNLTWKRTSHKIAEQGRRNRINTALQEMAALLPRPPQKEGEGETAREGSGAVGKEGDERDGAAAATSGDKKEGGGRSGGGGINSSSNSSNGGSSSGSGSNIAPNSKASTVEMAIDYIKQLQKEVWDANKRASEAEEKLKRKQELEGGTGGAGDGDGLA